MHVQGMQANMSLSLMLPRVNCAVSVKLARVDADRTNDRHLCVA